ncbi:hypothetical protein VC187_20575, partial [Xanthomonas campestris]|nr:hypothetical protein [Xanthomonas campestris]
MEGDRMRPSLLLLPLAFCAACSRIPPPVTPPGAEETTKTNVLEAGAKVLQSNGPVGKLDIYLVLRFPHISSCQINHLRRNRLEESARMA